MPRRESPHVDLHSLDLEERVKQPDRCQEAWYTHFSKYVSGKDVLDVGAGSGYGVQIFRNAGAKSALGIDLLPLSKSVELGSVSMFPADSFDIVTSMDVIEHVVHHEEFLASLLRVARECVMLSTPNWNRHRCRNKYHVREYTPAEFKLLINRPDAVWFIGDGQRNISQVDYIPDNSDANDFGVMVRL